MATARPPELRQAERAALEARLARLGAGGGRSVAVAPLGAPDLDAALPGGGLRFAALHEVTGSGAAGFVAALVARCALARPTALLWCQQHRRVREEGALYGPGLAAAGIDPARLLVVDAWDDGEALWVLEEALRSPAIAAAVAEVAAADLFRSRRLQLAAEAGGGAAFLLGPRRPAMQPSAAMTRWHVQLRAPPAAAGSSLPEPGPLAWRAELWRVKGAVPTSFEVGFDASTLCFHLAAELADRPLSPGRRQTG